MGHLPRTRAEFEVASAASNELFFSVTMSEHSDPFRTLRPFRGGHLYSLPALEEQGLGTISRLPVSIRIVLESILRNCDGKRVDEADVKRLAAYDAKHPSASEIPFVVSRIVLQDFTGVPLLVDPRRDACGRGRPGQG